MTGWLTGWLTVAGVRPGHEAGGWDGSGAETRQEPGTGAGGVRLLGWIREQGLGLRAYDVGLKLEHFGSVWDWICGSSRSSS